MHALGLGSVRTPLILSTACGLEVGGEWVKRDPFDETGDPFDETGSAKKTPFVVYGGRRVGGPEIVDVFLKKDF